MSSTNDRGVDDGDPAVAARSLATQRPPVSSAAELRDQAEGPTGGIGEDKRPIRDVQLLFGVGDPDRRVGGTPSE